MTVPMAGDCAATSASLRYGVVQVVVHDSQVTQIEKTERVRLDKAPAQTKTIWADRKVGV